MTTSRIADMQRRIGAEPDGFWGPQSIAACQVYLRRMMAKALAKASQRWPGTSQAELTAFYGNPGDERQLVNLDVDGLGLLYEGTAVRTVRCHRKVAESLKRILIEISQGPFKDILARYAGVYNHRLMRGGSLPSLHARGAAIDLWPETNANLTPWPISATMPLEVMEAFARQGWVSAGAFWGRDAMHFQATQV